MCILSAIVDKVASTKLFTCVLNDGERQFIVYSNTVDTPIQNNTMILPVPNPESVQFVDLSQYKNFFEDCQSSFRKKYDESYDSRYTCSLRSAAADHKPLPVYTVGSYAVSIVPSAADFARLDRSQFSIERTLPPLLAQKYDDPSFGYLVCKLRKGNHSYHPFAYTHDIHTNHLLFLPTYHIHPDGTDLMDEKEADWDHVIYAVDTDLEQANIPIDQSPEYYFGGWQMNWSKVPEEIRWIKNSNGQRIAISGMKKNKDLWLRNRKDFTRGAALSDPNSYQTAEFPVFGKAGLKNIRKFFQ